MFSKSILSIGLFIDEKNYKKNIRTAEDRCAELFSKNNITVIKTSSKHSRALRILDNIYTIIIRRNDYEVALIPLFGTRFSIIWHEINVAILKWLKKKIIISVHGGSIPAQMDIDPSKFLKRLGKADIIICPSIYLHQHLKKFNVQSFVIENNINLEEYIFNKKEKIRPNILWMRALSDVYNPFMAVRVAAILANKFKDLKMIIAGKDGELSASTKQLAKELNVDDKIIFPGYINHKEKLAFAKDYDIYICTNKVDNAPVSLIEFMALGLPVVSVNTGGIPDMIEDNENGLLVNFEDAEAMAKQIEKLILDPYFTNKIICNARTYAEQYDDKNVLKKWTNIFKKITQENFYSNRTISSQSEQ